MDIANNEVLNELLCQPTLDNAINISHIYYSNNIEIILKTESCNNANFVITDATAGCHKDKLLCHMWRQSWHYDNSRFSVKVFMKCCWTGVHWTTVLLCRHIDHWWIIRIPCGLILLVLRRVYYKAVNSRPCLLIHQHLASQDQQQIMTRTNVDVPMRNAPKIDFLCCMMTSWWHGHIYHCPPPPPPTSPSLSG